MTTLADMKARILSQTKRQDLTDAIADEITSAIKFYQSKDLWISRKRAEASFDTVADQSIYTSDDDEALGRLVKMEYALLTYQGRVIRLRFTSPPMIEAWIGSISAVLNPPQFFSWYDERLFLYPTPDAAYPVTISGVFKVAAPASDSETGNVWMTEGEELIRARATRNLYLNYMMGTEDALVQQQKALEDEAYKSLRQETSKKTQVNSVRPTPGF